MDRIYLDHTATTPLDPRVLEAMLPHLSGVFGNPSSIHSYGREAKQALERSREILAGAIGAMPGEIVFTSGGTESDNFAILGTARAMFRKGRRVILTSAAEHHAVLDTCMALREEGHDVRVLPVDAGGEVSHEAFSSSVGPGVALASIMLANNEVGTITSLGPLADAARAHGVPVHTDAVQALGRIAVNVNAPRVDLMSLSAHKCYGPKSVGVLYVRKGTVIDPLFRGGGQERGRRPGTEHVALAVGFAKAVELAVSEMESESERVKALRDSLERRLRERFPSLSVNGKVESRLPHILNVSFDSTVLPLEGEMLVPGLDLLGIAVTSGSACTSGSMQPSHVLQAMGCDAASARSAIRFSLGRSNSESDLKRVVAAVEETVAKARRRERPGA
jgi:cysteine desulfurase